MHYWIFVHKSEDVNNSFPQLMKLKNWGFKFSQPITKKIKAVQKGDIVIFYVGGSGAGYFSGEAILKSNVHEPTRESLGGTKDSVIDVMVDFDNMNMWDGEKIDLTQRSNRVRLGFIKNKDNWGMSVGQSIIAITEKDYNEIKSLLALKQASLKNLARHRNFDLFLAIF